MTSILSFDSMYLANPLRKFYLSAVRQLLESRVSHENRLVLYRLDKDNIFIREKRNLSGMAIGLNATDIDALSLKFYRHLENSISCPAIKIKNQQLYSLYTRQVKLKLAGILRCALRIQNLSKQTEVGLEIISDRQTICVMNEAFKFLNFSPENLRWTSNFKLTTFITCNSIIMRIAALIKMLITPTSLPKEYFFKKTNPNAPSILITMPRRRPEDFFESYVEKLDKKFNIFIYSIGFLRTTPDGYQRAKVKRKMGILRGTFNLNYLFWNSQSYIADILIIFKSHSNLSMSIDSVNSLYKNKIDAHISRLQTNVLDNYLAIEARRKEIFILGDIMEEIFYCDAAICSSKSEFTEATKLALDDTNKIIFKGSNSNINYRLSNFSSKEERYLNQLIGVEREKKVIFYASDPSKEESQRYLTEKFLFTYFSQNSEFTFAIKTHPQDDGKITNSAYLDAGQPSNAILIGDRTQHKTIVSKAFNIFKEFDFNSAIASCDVFLTSSSSSILQAVVLKKKSGIVDLFENGFYDYLVKNKATMIINGEKSLDDFLLSSPPMVDNSMLSYFGLKSDSGFNLVEHLHQSLKIYSQEHEKSKLSTL
tara:strand:+ start:1870 stop:3654 length:1785 start_codon:yes stop_codon:yes gene_type:complete